MKDRFSLSEFAEAKFAGTEFEPKDAEHFLKHFFVLIESALLMEGVVKVRSFGTFKLQRVEKRRSVSVRNGEEVEIPAHYKIVFQADKEINDHVNGLLAVFESIEIDDSDFFFTGEERPEAPEVPVIEDPMVIEEQPQPESVVKYIPLYEGALPPSAHELNEGSLPVSDADLKSEGWLANLKSHLSVYLWIYFSSLLAISAIVFLFIVIAERLNPSEPIIPMDNVEALSEQKPSSILQEDTIADEMMEDKNENPSVPADDLVVMAEEFKEVVVKKGERLTKIAMEHFGDKVFWIYIFEENRALLKSPNNIAPGMKLQLPSKEKYNINPSDPASVDSARQKGEEEFRKNKR